MNAGLVNPTFWLSMMLALTVAFIAAVPVNAYLLARGKGHALTHEFHGNTTAPTGLARFMPAFATSTLVAVIIAFMLGGLIVSIADQLSEFVGAACSGSKPSCGRAFALPRSTASVLNAAVMAITHAAPSN